MENTHKLVVFRLDESPFSLHLHHVDRILPLIEIQPLPMAPEYILGTINFHGDFLPVVNLRKLFMLPSRELELSDQLIITTTSKHKVALWVDEVIEIAEVSNEEIGHTKKILLDIDYMQGLFNLRDGMVLIHDPERFLTPEHLASLEVALNARREQAKLKITENKPKAQILKSRKDK